MSQTLELIIKARDEASASLKNIGNSLNSFAMALPAMAAGAAVYGKALKEIGDLAKGYMDYAIAAGDFAEKTGVATEEASALLDLIEDMEIPIGTLEMAFRSMAKAGIDPSIEGLIEVRGRLADAGSDAERLALALKLMGRSGEDLLPILAQLNDEQLRALVGNLSEAQTVTDAEYRKMLALRAEMEVFNDTMESAKLISGEWIISNLGVMDALQRLNSVLSGTVSYWQALIGYLGIAQGAAPASNQYGNRGGIPLGPAPKPVVNPRFMSGGGFAAGGIIVGEHGAERFTPGVPGQVSPNNDELTREMRRLLRTLPVILRDAVQKK